MDFNLDESKILYGLGAFLGVISIIYFGHELILGLSPTVKSFILVSASAIFILSGDLTSNNLLKNSVYVFSGFAYIIFLTYVFAKFDLSQLQTFGLLAGSSAAFISLGYLRSEDIYSLNPDKSKKIISFLAVLLVISVGFDVLGSQPEHQLELKDDVKVSEDEEFSVGVIRVENNFPLSRNIDLSNYKGCIAYNKSFSDNLYFYPEGSGIIGGGETQKFDLNDRVHFRGPPVENHGEEIEQERKDISATYEVKNMECPEELESQTIYLTSDNDSSSIYGGRTVE